MVINIGSMAVKAVFNGAGLLSGLGKTSDKFKEVSQRSKSTTTEMKRMQHGAHTLRNALAMIGVGGFSALLMTAPQLAGSLAKIKYEMQQLAWSIGKHLKPSLDAVSTILRGIRTGDWSTVITGVNELAQSLINLAGVGVSKILDPIIGKENADKIKTDFNNWISEMIIIAEEANLWAALWHGGVSFTKWLEDNQDLLNNWCDTFNKKFDELATKLTDFITPEWLKEIARSLDAFDDWVGRNTFDKLGINLYELSGGILGKKQIGGYVPQTGLYNLHAGETVTMKGSNGMSNNVGSSNITLDFSGANINLASGIELDEFANQISLKIAERQNTLTY